MCKVFYFKKYDFNPQTGLLSLVYGVGEKYLFKEEVVFPGAPFHLSNAQKQVLKALCFLTHIAAGISYYKAFLPPRIEIESGCLSKEQARFFERFYLEGLGEFAVRNHLNLQGKIHFPYQDSPQMPTPFTFQAGRRVLVPVGGGKDSCVSIELLRQNGAESQLVSIGGPKAILDCAAASGYPHVLIRRHIDPALMTLNETGTVYNGHVPITGILAFYLWILALLTDTPHIVMSCERSANFGNMRQGALSINHQYSKSLAFERDFDALTQVLTPGFHYFSLLRPFSELQIARLFARLCRRYFNVFTSCNKAFRLNEAKRFTHWCAECDKCRFVFLILAPFMAPEDLIQAVGRNLLDDETQETGYRALLGLEGHKPFECVGTPEECRMALFLAARHPFWQKSRLVQKLLPALSPLSQEAQEALWSVSQAHLIPSVFQPILSYKEVLAHEMV